MNFWFNGMLEFLKLRANKRILVMFLGYHILTPFYIIPAYRKSGQRWLSDNDNVVMILPIGHGYKCH